MLLIDADPQGSLTASLGFGQPDEINVTLATIMTKIMHSVNGEVFLLVSHRILRTYLPAERLRISLRTAILS